jgi:uncharacterized protein YecE (DUF72 family)
MIWVGTSGYNYPEWKGSFYPQDLPAAKMLPYYAARFPTVEINYTFYRMPNEKLVAGWAAQTPDPYKLTLKAPRRITHDSRLRNCGDLVSAFCGVAGTLGDKLGALLFQLPPNFKKNPEVLREFVELVPEGTRAAFEFRHESWFDDEVRDALRERKAVLCTADTEEGGPAAEIAPTADWGYLRLRRADYTDDGVGAWADRIRAQPWQDAFVFFKHEDEARGPALAERLIALTH